MTRVGIINVTGYAGAELARILARHPGVALTEVTGRSAAGKPLESVFPHLGALGLTIQEDIHQVDVCFTALPHHASAEIVPALLARGHKVVDISADFRLHDRALYERWYGKHPAPELLDEAVYGLPELHGQRVAEARLVANPGCYPTASILALAPIAHLLEPEVVIDAKSGISGAGRTMNLSVNHFCEVNENVQAYGLNGHRHQPEIVQELNALRQTRIGADCAPIDITFVPHLIPMTRGILVTCYGRLQEPMSRSDILETYRAFYRGKPFVRVVDYPPQTKQTLGNNDCVVHPRVDDSGRRVLVIACIDNLVKGAAGQAVQNMNLMLGLPEDMGLEGLAVFP